MAGTPEQSQKALVSAGQRRVNLLWEYTQAAIAISVVITTMIAAVYGYIKNKSGFPDIISVAFGTVVGFYFGRTNHQRTGGVEGDIIGR